MGNTYLDDSECTSATDSDAPIINESKSEEMQDEDEIPELPELKEYKGRTYSIEIAAGAILGGLSALVGFIWDATLETIAWGPSFAPGMTWLDIMAVPMLVAFFIFGIRSGLIAAVVGCLAIIGFPGDQGIGWLSMWPKFIASSIMFVIPWLILKIIQLYIFLVELTEFL